MVVFAFLAAIAQMIAPVLVSKMIDGVSGNDTQMIIVLAAAMIVLSVAFTGKLALVLAIAIPLLITLVAAILITASRYSVKLRGKIDVINQLFLEALEGVRVIRAFNKQEFEIKRFDEENEETTEVSRKSIAISGMMMPAVNSLFGLTLSRGYTCDHQAP